MKPILTPLLTNVLGNGSSPAPWTPAALFAKYGGIGGYWDWTDIATLSQDSAGTTPVTAASQPVGRALDKSGQGNHVIQSDFGKRPQYNGAGITPDGVDDFMVTAGNLDLTACDKCVVAMGYTKVDDVVRMQMELSNTAIDFPGTFWLLSGANSGYQTTISHGSGLGNNSQQAFFPTARANTYAAHIGRHSTPGDLSEVWWNGVKGTDGIGDKGTGSFGSYPLNVLARNGGAFASNTPTRRALVMGVPVAGPQVSDDDIELIRLWLMEGA